MLDYFVTINPTIDLLTDFPAVSLMELQSEIAAAEVAIANGVAVRTPFAMFAAVPTAGTLPLLLTGLLAAWWCNRRRPVSHIASALGAKGEHKE